MSEIRNNNTTKRNNPTKKITINRNNLSYSEEQYLLEAEWGMQYMEQDINQTLVLYQVDREKTEKDNIYNESGTDKIRFKTPVEIHCSYNIEDSTNKAYEKNKSLNRYSQTGQLTFSVYERTLTDLDCDIKYGDYIGVVIDEETIIYFIVTDDGKKNFANKQTLYGYKPIIRNCVAAPVDITEFGG